MSGIKYESSGITITSPNKTRNPSDLYNLATLNIPDEASSAQMPDEENLLDPPKVGTNFRNEGVDTDIVVGVNCLFVRKSNVLIKGSGTY